MIERIKQVIEYSQLSTSAFADTIGISRSGLTHLLTGRNQPSLDVARKILAKFPEISTEWLIMGMGEMYRPEELHQRPDDNEVTESVPEPYPAESAKINAQADLFGEYALPDDSGEDVTDTSSNTVDTIPQELPDDEQDTVSDGTKTVAAAEPKAEMEEPHATAAPVAAPTQPARVPAVPVRQRKTAADARPTPAQAPVRRERHIPAPPQEKKLQKIVFFYDDHSFEVFCG